MRLRPLRVSRRNGITKIPNSPMIMKYQIATNDHAMKINISATGTSNSHFNHALSESVIFQMRAAEPENDVGADITTFSDASLLPIYSATS